jgi:hypothetical protein
MISQYNEKRPLWERFCVTERDSRRSTGHSDLVAEEKLRKLSAVSLPGIGNREQGIGNSEQDPETCSLFPITRRLAPDTYSYRNAIMGSTFVARWAGM